MRPKNILTLLLTLLALAACSDNDQQPGAEKKILTVTVKPPVLARFNQSASASGWIEPWCESPVAAEIDGFKIASVSAEVGDMVEKGQELAVLDDSKAQAELARLAAAVELARAEHSVAKINAGRAARLIKENAVSHKEHDEALATEKVKAAELAMAEANLKLQGITLAQTRILAPEAGLISAKSAEPGAVVASGAELFRIIVDGRVEWRAEVAVKHLFGIKPGQVARLVVPGLGSFEGVVRKIAPAAEKSSARAIAYVDLPQEAGFKSGAYASGAILLGEYEALAVPEAALVLRDGFYYIFVFRPETGRVERIRVTSGQRAGGMVEITGGLAPGALVVQSGGPFLSDNAAVEVLGGVE